MLRVRKPRNCSKIAGRDKTIFPSSKMSKPVLVSVKPLFNRYEVTFLAVNAAGV